MKTGMEWGLASLLAILALVGLWNMYSEMQLDYAVASLSATAAGQTAPEAVMIGGQWVVKAIVGTLIGGVVTAGLALLVGWARREWRKSQKQKWKSGPNANWQQQPREPQPRQMSEAEFYRMMLAQNMRGGQAGRAPRMEGEDEPIIKF